MSSSALPAIVEHFCSAIHDADTEGVRQLLFKILSDDKLLAAFIAGLRYALKDNKLTGKFHPDADMPSVLREFLLQQRTFLPSGQPNSQSTTSKSSTLDLSSDVSPSNTPRQRG